MPRIFLCHDSEDEDLAKKLRQLIVSTLNVMEQEIISSGLTSDWDGRSVYQLKEELMHVDVLFILLTNQRRISTWTLFNYGAFVSPRRPAILLLGPAVNTADLPPPLRQLTAIQMTSKGVQLDLRRTLNSVANSLRLDTVHIAEKEELDLIQAYRHRPKPSLRRVLQVIRSNPALLVVLVLSIGMITMIHQAIGASLMIQWSNSQLKAFCLNYSSKRKEISCGESDLFENQPPMSDAEAKGREAFVDGDYKVAYEELRSASSLRPSDPSLKIAMNNAETLHRLQNQPTTRAFTVAITLPTKKSKKFIAHSLLAGVAEKQQRFNQNPYGVRIFVIMADDMNQPKNSADLAELFQQKSFVLALIGPYSSESTFYQIDRLKNRQLLLMSASSTASISAYQLRFKEAFDYAWFQRSVSTTKSGAKQLVQQIQASKPRNNRILLFYQGSKEDLFVTSFLRDFKDNLNQTDIEIDRLAYQKKDPNAKTSSTLMADQEKGIDLGNVRDNDEIRAIIQRFKQKQSVEASTGEIIVVVIPNAFRETHDAVDAILTENKNGDLLIFGANTLYDPQRFELVKLNPAIGRKLIINLPWYPDADRLPPHLRTPKELSLAGQEPIGWQYGPAYDAITVLTQSFERLIDQGQPVTRTTLQRSIADAISQQRPFSGIDPRPFRLGPSSRSPEQSHLVRPECVESNCSWRLIRSDTFNFGQAAPLSPERPK
ncbi:MAG: hypothetical protein ACK587_00920 [Cyanobacteriota bacterium]